MELFSAGRARLPRRRALTAPANITPIRRLIVRRVSGYAAIFILHYFRDDIERRFSGT